MYKNKKIKNWINLSRTFEASLKNISCHTRLGFVGRVVMLLATCTRKLEGDNREDRNFSKSLIT